MASNRDERRQRHCVLVTQGDGSTQSEDEVLKRRRAADHEPIRSSLFRARAGRARSNRVAPCEGDLTSFTLLQVHWTGRAS